MENVNTNNVNGDVTISKSELDMLLGKITEDENDKEEDKTKITPREEFIKKIKVGKPKTAKNTILTKEEIAFLLGNNEQKGNNEHEIGE